MNAYLFSRSLSFLDGLLFKYQYILYDLRENGLSTSGLGLCWVVKNEVVSISKKREKKMEEFPIYIYWIRRVCNLYVSTFVFLKST